VSEQEAVWCLVASLGYTMTRLEKN